MKSIFSLLALPLALFVGVLPSFAADKPKDVSVSKKPILLVLTNHGKLGDTGKPTGFFLSEAAHPWKVFKAAGYTVEIASPAGGFAPLDPKSDDLTDPANQTFWDANGKEVNGVKGVSETLDLSKLKPETYAAVFYAGGHGAMWDFAESEAVQKFTANVYENGGSVGAVCHGPAALAKVTLSDGSPLVKGKKVAIFTNAEEAAVELTSTVPFLLQDSLNAAGASSIVGENFKENAVRDGRLVTGQNPASATLAAKLLVESLTEK